MSGTEGVATEQVPEVKQLLVQPFGDHLLSNKPEF